MDSITETLTISGDGAITGYNWTGTNVSPFQYCTVNHIVIKEVIIALCNYLFHTVYDIESFSIPASVTTIQTYALTWSTFVGGAGMVFLWKLVISKLGGVFAIYELLPAFIFSSICIIAVSLMTMSPSKEIEADFEAVKNNAVVEE
ncbi:MAG: hypothetical protein PUE73_08170 [Eubacteriales bacterium]|nr:hypothetical protein [Eubacteriales bacterium]